MTTNKKVDRPILAADKRVAAVSVPASSPISIAQVLRRPPQKPILKTAASSPKASSESSANTSSRTLKAIYLVQRGRIERPISVTSLYAAVDLIYMGAAEFENGSLPCSLKRLHDHYLANETSFVSFPSIRFGDLQLLGFGPFNAESQLFYEERLQHVIKRQAILQEQTLLPELLDSFNSPGVSLARNPKDLPDFWWDIQNDVLLFFDIDFKAKLVDILSESWRKLNQQKS